MRIVSDFHQRYRLFAVAGLLCVCVFAQMFNKLVLPLNELTIASMLTESESEDSSLLSPLLELNPSGVLHLCVVRYSTPALPVLATSIFHPPLI